MDTKIITNDFKYSSVEQQLEVLTRDNTVLLDILDNIPIGLAIFKRTSDTLYQVIAINQQLVNFGNSLREYHHIPESIAKNFSWTKASLTKAFEHNICAFCESEDEHLVLKMLADAAKKHYASCRFRLKGTGPSNTRWIESKCVNKQSSAGEQIDYILFADVTSQVLWEEELEHIGSHDSMTGVYNRYQYNKFMEANKHNTFFNTGVIFADVNGLKAINDTLGHATGDELVRQTASVLQKYFDSNSIYRISGDEFVVILSDIDENLFQVNVSTMMTAMSYYQIASIGYTWDASLESIKSGVYKAEQLMKIEKQKYYSNHITVASRHRSQTLDILLDDLAHNRYLVYLQPKADICTNKIIGAEALIRKLDNDGNIVLPYEFVPVLENELLISRIDFFVLEETCKLLSRWKSEGKPLIKISVNMSRVSVAENDFIEHVTNICDRYQTPKNLIEFEITESTTTKDNRNLYQTVAALHEKGFGFSLDDMGSDYSSLSLLSLYGLNTVKLDRSMILKIDEPQGTILLKHIIAMCHELGQTCIAEGVENESQRNKLADMNCDFYQGYLIDKPIPIDTFEKQHLIHATIPTK